MTYCDGGHFHPDSCNAQWLVMGVEQYLRELSDEEWDLLVARVRGPGMPPLRAL